MDDEGSADKKLADERIARHVVARGRVQGVGYRAFVEHHATQRNLKGWVRNRRDGSVEAVFVGPPDDVVEMIAACRKGPSSGSVTAVDVRDATESELALGAKEFSVLPTA